MEKGFESWFQNQQIDWKSPNPNSSSGAPIGLGPPKESVRQEPCGWFYGLPPRYRQGFIQKLPEASSKDVGVQKKFLVFDQSGDQTTLIYSSGGGIAPIRHHFPPSVDPKLQSVDPLRVDECVEENDGNGSRSEMREDSEELNALLYSDDDDDDDVNDDDDGENEEMSTGHSPNSTRGFKRKNCEEEVGSSVGPTKRYKREERGNIVNSLEDTASSGKSGVNCSGKSNDFSDCNEKVRKEKMKEIISLLQNLIPGGKNDRNALMVIDEAIHYLRSLKEKAKALGLDSL